MELNDLIKKRLTSDINTLLFAYSHEALKSEICLNVSYKVYIEIRNKLNFEYVDNLSNSLPWRQ